MTGTQVEREHNLPMLRVHRAWHAGEDIAEKNGVDPGVALEIAREVIAIVGDGTQRWGNLCPACRSLLEWVDNWHVCPEHGRLSGMAGTVLLITFDPVVTDV